MSDEVKVENGEEKGGEGKDDVAQNAGAGAN